MLPYSNSKITMELRDVLKMKDENGSPFVLWDFDYPSYYKDDAKKAFEQKVIDHYLFRQIGAETVARFKHNFKTRIREIMPYYIQRYKSVEIMEGIEDPFGNLDVVETFEQESTDTATGTSNTTENGNSSSSETAYKTDYKEADEDKLHEFSNTPQGEIANLQDYLTEASKDTNTQREEIESNGTVETSNESTITNTGTSESSSTGNIKHTLTRKGNQGVNTYAHDMIEFRQSFINVDMEIINELNDLFLLIY